MSTEWHTVKARSPPSGSPQNHNWHHCVQGDPLFLKILSSDLPFLGGGCRARLSQGPRGICPKILLWAPRFFRLGAWNSIYSNTEIPLLTTRFIKRPFRALAWNLSARPCIIRMRRGAITAMRLRARHQEYSDKVKNNGSIRSSSGMVLTLWFLYYCARR